MKVILRKDVDNLGKMGEVVTVKNGYARNYLIPKELAYFATKHAERQIEVEKIQWAKKQAKEREAAVTIAEKLEEMQISIPMKVGDEGKLYGSVTQQMIAQELSLRGYDIDKRDIVLDEPIKTLGVFNVKVRLHSDVMGHLRIWVISEE